MIEIEGRGVERLDAETGGHRVQRIPRSDKNGRVHSSTVTVAVLDCRDPSTEGPWGLRADKDFRTEWFSGSGSGGQHRNKHMNSARVTHIPSGTVRAAQTRSRENSRQSAMAAMNEELDRQAGLATGAIVNGERRGQVGSGERSDKRRTYRFQEGQVHDHTSGRIASCERVMHGDFRTLWK